MDKVILLSPVKNEEWIIADSIKNWQSFADFIIIADQKSDDKTVSIVQSLNKVKVITNPFKGYTNEVRFLLLDEARKIPGNNLIVCLDADEQISPDFVEEIKQYLKKFPNIDSIGFSSKWLQMYNKINLYRDDRPWKNNYKTFCFLDNRKNDYDRKKITNEHIARIPQTDITVKINTPIIHFQWLAKKRSQIKQALYMCTETVDGWNQKITNNRYYVAKFLPNPKLKILENKYLKNTFLPEHKKLESYPQDKLNLIKKMFSDYGTLKFEGLDIWEVPELMEIFLAENNRKPGQPKQFPFIIIKLNNIKNYIKNYGRMCYNYLNEKISRKL